MTVVAEQIGKNSINIEADAENVKCIKERLTQKRKADSVSKHLAKYEHTENLNTICGFNIKLFDESAVQNKMTAIL